MLSCNEVLAKHSDYIDGMLALDASQQFQSHLEHCPACARYDRTLRKGICILNDQARVEPDPDFLLQLHSRIADEERGRLQPISVSAAASVSIAAVLALAAWLPIVMKQIEQPVYLHPGTETISDLNAAEIVWRGALAAGATEERPSAKLMHTSADVSLIDHGYSPLILEAPTAPPSYGRLTSLETR